MAILMQHKAQNGAEGNYFRINRIDGICSPREPVPRWEVWVGFYASEEVRRDIVDPIMSYNVAIPFSALDPRNTSMPALYEAIKSYYPFAGNTVIDAIEDSANLQLDVAKALKKEEINQARLAANSSSFPYMEKHIACDALSRGDLDGVANSIALTGTFPQGFPYQWKTKEETYLPIPDVPAFAALYGAMTAQGTANFIKAQGLKGLVDQCVAVNQVYAIQWDGDLTTFVLPEPIEA